MNARRLIALIANLICATIVFQGCIHLTPKVSERASTTEASAELSSSSSSGLPPEATASKPVTLLLTKAEAELVNGNLEQSAASLERALRIAPRDPTLWHHLAAVRLQQKEFHQAETMAYKSNSFIGTGKTSLLRKNWQIIAEARRLQGDEAGAEEAERYLQNSDTSN